MLTLKPKITLQIDFSGNAVEKPYVRTLIISKEWRSIRGLTWNEEMTIQRKKEMLGRKFTFKENGKLII
jgi:hypothetical protein